MSENYIIVNSLAQTFYLFLIGSSSFWQVRRTAIKSLDDNICRIKDILHGKQTLALDLGVIPKLQIFCFCNLFFTITSKLLSYKGRSPSNSHKIIRFLSSMDFALMR